MVKNKLESKFSESFRALPYMWGMKLQNNMLAHTVTPADFLIHFHAERITYLCKTEDITSEIVAPYYPLISNLVECKQVTCEPGENGKLAFSRLKQTHDLIRFDFFSGSHKSYYLIGFLEPRWENSEVYLVPARNIELLQAVWHKVSINRDEFKSKFSQYRMVYQKGAVLDADMLKRCMYGTI